MIDRAKLGLVKELNLKLKGSMKHCVICPRRCGVDRSAGKLGYCKAGNESRVYSFLAHQGEEPPISGKCGSGTIFFSHCNMRCAYCQNYQFSQMGEGGSVSIDKLAKIMTSLQESGCHNINLVTPTHYMPQIMAALEIALENGLKIPIVYNTSGYELPDILSMLDGIVDIYLPDMRYFSSEMAGKYSDAPDYVDHNRASIKEMFRQVGDLSLDKDGLAIKGVIIRLLVLPKDVSGTVQSLRYIKENLSGTMYLSIMSQYSPAFKATERHEISRRIIAAEYKIVVDEAHELGLNNGWIQENPEDESGRFLGTNIKPKIEL